MNSKIAVFAVYKLSTVFATLVNFFVRPPGVVIMVSILSVIRQRTLLESVAHIPFLRLSVCQTFEIQLRHIVARETRDDAMTGLETK